MCTSSHPIHRFHQILAVTTRVLPPSLETGELQTLDFPNISGNTLIQELAGMQPKQRKGEVSFRDSLQSVIKSDDDGFQAVQPISAGNQSSDDEEGGASCASSNPTDEASGAKSKAHIGTLVQSIRSLPPGEDIEVLMSDSGWKLSNHNLNKILAAFEDLETMLRFFDWMRQTGKTKSNSHALRILLRVLSQKRDWQTVEKYLRETEDMGPNAELFGYNTLLLAAESENSSEMATRWFNRMLMKGVAPNNVTYGAVMRIYQKARKVGEAEKVLAHMQTHGPETCNAYTSMIVLYMKAGLFDKAEQLVRDMTARNVAADEDNLIVQLNVFSQQGKVAECEKLMENLKNINQASGIVAYNSMIVAYGKAKMFDKVMVTLQELKDCGLKADHVTYNSLIGACGKADKVKEAVQIYEEMKAAGFKPTRTSFGTLVGLHGRANNLTAVSRMLMEMTDCGLYPDAKILERVVKAYENCRKLITFPRLYTAMLEAGWVPDVGCSNVMFSVYLKLKMPQKALQHFEILRQAQMMPRELLCHNLLLCLRNAKRYDDVVKVFDELLAEGLTPGLDMCCTMIDVYGLMGTVSKAEELFAKVRQSTQKLDVVPYNVMLNVYMRAGLDQSASETLKLLQTSGFVPDACTFSALLRVYQKNGLQLEAADLYRKMVKAGIKLDAALYNCVINCCGRALALEETAAIFNKMLDEGYSPNTITYNLMIDLYGKQGYLQRASKVLKQAQDQGMADRISFSTLVNAYGKLKNFSKMEETVWEMQRSGFAPGLDTYNAMLDGYGKASQFSNMEEVLDRMERAGCQKDRSSYNILLNVYGRKKMMKELQDVLSQMRSTDIKPDRYTYNTLIKTYGNVGEPDEAVRIFREMHDAGFMPDFVTYSNLIAAFEKSGNLLEAARWSLWMKQAGYSKRQQNA